METLTKTILVGGQEMVMLSLDGRSWFLRSESMRDFENRVQQIQKMDTGDFGEFEPEPIVETLASLL